MHTHIKRRKRLLLSVAAGAVGAAAVYCWLSDGKRGSADQAAAAATAEDGAAKEAGSGDKEWVDQFEAEQQEAAASSIDSSMSSHFQFIQDVSTPQELEQLLPRVKAVIYEMTDVQAALAALPADAPAKAKLEVLAQHSFSRALAAVWLLPALDLLVRAKLNIVGRHLFLQERLSQLPAVAEVLHLRAGRDAEPRGLLLPSRIHASAIQEFLPCEHLATTGCHWVVTQVLEAVRLSLSQLSLEAQRGPEDLVALLAALQAHVNSALTPSSSTSTAGGGWSWPTLLLGNQPEPHPHLQGIPSSSGELLEPEADWMLQELQDELRTALSSRHFEEAMHSAVQHCFRLLVQHVVEMFPAAPAPGEGKLPQGEMTSEEAQGREQVGVQQQARLQGEQGPAKPLHEGRTWGAYFRSFLPWDSAPQGGTGHHGSSAAAATATISAYNAGIIYANKPPRPTARLLRPVQLASDPLFVDVAELSKGIASLGPVLALSASIFARPVL